MGAKGKKIQFTSVFRKFIRKTKILLVTHGIVASEVTRAVIDSIDKKVLLQQSEVEYTYHE